MSLEEVETAHSSEVTTGSYTADTSVDLEGSETSSGKPSADLRRGLLGSPVTEQARNSILHHYYPPCHYLERLRRWGAKNTINAKRISWVCGPAGIGKSALAHSFADSLGPKLGAFFCFSEINHTNNPSHFFPSISYQLSLRIKPYAASVDEIVQQNPVVYGKPLSQQFHELFVRPLRDTEDKEWFLDEPIVIIDGLEECADERAQENIIKIIAQSVRERSTPFRWLFLGRPEPQLLNTFDIPNILSYTFQLELSISRQFDHEIGSFLVDELRKIGQKHGLPQSWPSEQDIRTLLDLSAGLPIYASAAIQFIDKSTMHTPDENLRTILRLPRYLSQSIRGHHLRGLYQLYTLVMERIPLDLLPSAQRILLAGCLRMITLSGQRLLSFLSLSESQFQSACAALSPVIQVADDCSITFFHSSLLDFVSDTAFSGDFCVLASPALTFREELLRRLNETLSAGLMGNETSTAVDSAQPRAYQDIVNGFCKLLYLLPLDDQFASVLRDFNFHKLCMFGELTIDFGGLPLRAVDIIVTKMPDSLRNKIVHPIRDRSSISYGIDRAYSTRRPAHPASSYILGRGDKKAFFWCNHDSASYTVIPYPKHRILKYLAQAVAGTRPHSH